MNAIKWMRSPATVKLLRVEALTLTVIGIAFFVAAAIIAPALGWEPPRLVWRVGLILEAVGALWLVGLLGWIYPKEQKVTGEAVLGFISILIGMLSLIAALGNEEKQLGVFWLVMAVILIPTSMAMIMLAAIKGRKPGAPPPATKEKPRQYKRFY
jgi:hypothetical protein